MRCHAACTNVCKLWSVSTLSAIQIYIGLILLFSVMIYDVWKLKGNKLLNFYLYNYVSTSITALLML